MSAKCGIVVINIMDLTRTNQIWGRICSCIKSYLISAVAHAACIKHASAWRLIPTADTCHRLPNEAFRHASKLMSERRSRRLTVSTGAQTKHLLRVCSKTASQFL
jgi:hypothetical protein